MHLNFRLRRRRSLAGFTLVELMVTVAIITILAAIALPSYQYSVRKSRRTEAKTAALDAAAREERYYATQNQYTSDTGQLQYTTGSGSFPSVIGSYYEIYAISIIAPTVSTTTGNVTTGGFTVAVSPSPGSPQAADTSCQTFFVDQTGRTSSTSTANDVNHTGTDTTSTCWP